MANCEKVINIRIKASHHKKITHSKLTFKEVFMLGFQVYRAIGTTKSKHIVKAPKNRIVAFVMEDELKAP